MHLICNSKYVWEKHETTRITFSFTIMLLEMLLLNASSCNIMIIDVKHHFVAFLFVCTQKACYYCLHDPSTTKMLLFSNIQPFCPLVCDVMSSTITILIAFMIVWKQSLWDNANIMTNDKYWGNSRVRHSNIIHPFIHPSIYPSSLQLSRI